MPLTFIPNPDSEPAQRHTDQLVMCGKLPVGRIYKREPASGVQWLWTINGVQRAGPDVMRVSGMTASLDQARAELKENWEKWLAWANLQEVSGP
jgi:hypothetical protein